MPYHAHNIGSIRGLLDNFVAAGYGGVIQNVTVGISDINATPQIIPANTGIVSESKVVTQDVANDGLRFGFSGVWVLYVIIAVDFDFVNTGRVFSVEVFDVTTASVVTSIFVAVGRNAEGSTFTAPLMVEVGLGNVGDLFVIRLVSTTDTFTGVALTSYQLSASLVSELLVIP